MKRVLNIMSMLFICSMLFCLPVKAADSRISVSQDGDVISWSVDCNELIRNYDLYFYELPVDSGKSSDFLFVGLFKTTNKEFNLSDIQATILDKRLTLVVTAVNFDGDVVATSEMVPVVASIHSNVSGITNVPTITAVRDFQLNPTVSSLKNESRYIHTGTSKYIGDDVYSIPVIVENGLGLEPFKQEFKVRVVDADFLFEDGTLTILKDDGFKMWRMTVDPKAVKKVVLAHNISTVPSEAFKGCTKLETVKVERQTNSLIIEDKAFRGCTSLTGDGGNIYSFLRKASYIGDYAFSGCTSLSKVKFRADALTYIGKYAFAGCKNIKDIRFCEACHVEEFTTDISTRAFNRCSTEGVIHFTDEIAMQSLEDAFIKGSLKFGDSKWQIEILPSQSDSIQAFEASSKAVKEYSMHYETVESWEDVCRAILDGSLFVSIDITDFGSWEVPSNVLTVTKAAKAVVRITSGNDTVVLFGDLIKETSRDVEWYLLAADSGLPFYDGICLHNNEIVMF